MTDYSKGRIYVIRNKINDLLYVGSTCQDLSKRFSWHKGDAAKEKKAKYGKLYKTVKELGGWDNFYIELVEYYPCETKEQLSAREGYFIRLFETTTSGYNTYVAGRTQKEYIQDNIERWNDYYKQYRNENRDEIRQKAKEKYHTDEAKQKRHEYYISNKDKIYERNKQWYELNKDKYGSVEQVNKRKEYYDLNKETILQRNRESYYRNKDKTTFEERQRKRKEYIESNKEKLLENQRKNGSVRVICDCGIEVRKDNLYKHKKTQTHQSLLL